MTCVLCGMDKTGECRFCRMNRMNDTYGNKNPGKSRGLSYLAFNSPADSYKIGKNGGREQWQDLRETMAYVKGMYDALAYVSGEYSESSGKSENYNLNLSSSGYEENSGEYDGS